MAQNMMRPPIILLRNGTDTSQGKGQLLSNINACEAVAEAVRTTLGPRGMDKLVTDGNKATISNDGAQIMTLLDIIHPAAKTLVDISLSQDAEVGDGTTSVVLIGGELLKRAKQFIEDGVHPTVIIRGYRRASLIALAHLNEIAVGVAQADDEGRRMLLERCAGTALNSKLICRNKGLFAPMCVEAVMRLNEDCDLNLVGIKKVIGGSVTDSFMVQGVAFKKTFSYAGFEQQTKSFVSPKILLLNVELELKSEGTNAEIRIDDVAKYQSIVDAEWNIIYDKLEKCVASGANIILSRLPIGDLATQYFADRGLFCAGRVEPADMMRVSKATGGQVQSSVEGVTEAMLGTCDTFEEVQIGNERYNMFKGCPAASTATIVLRGGAEQFLEEAHRSLWDALMVVKRSLKSSRVVAGGGAVEMELVRHLREASRAVPGKLQVIIAAFARALEVIPRQLSENAGFDSTDIMNKLRQKHTLEPVEGRWFGVDINNEGICDTYKSYVWEPAANKLNSIGAATEAACLVLSVDETVRNSQSEQMQMQKNGQMGGGGGAPMSAAMGGQGMRAMAQQQMGRGRGGGRGGRGRGVRMYRGRGGK